VLAGVRGAPREHCAAVALCAPLRWSAASPRAPGCGNRLASSLRPFPEKGKAGKPRWQGPRGPEPLPARGLQPPAEAARRSILRQKQTPRGESDRGGGLWAEG
jgi:hypothetical protein